MNMPQHPTKVGRYQVQRSIGQGAMGSVYLAESIGVEYTNRTQQMHANWIPANKSFTQWLKTP